jgi:radical SAM superfamily enzyme YgiQ (UPF0313 family)
MKNKKQKILLVEPPFQRLYHINSSLNKLPLSLAYLAGVIISRKPNWQVKIYNADFSPHDVPLDLKFVAGAGFNNYLKTLREPKSSIWAEVRSVINRFQPSVIGITVKSQNFAAALCIADIAKSIDEKITVVVGGPHVSMARAEILQHRFIDIGVFGEGEETIIEILNSIEGGQPLSSIKGILYRKEGKVIENLERELIGNLDALLFPIRVAQHTLIDFEKYPSEAFGHIFSIRGCPYNCSFCGSRKIWTRRVRFRSVENIIAEIKQIRQHGINYINFDDDTFGVRKAFIHQLCNAIKNECPRLNWSCEIHVNLVDDETIAIMKSAGCRSIKLGIESGNNEVLKSIRKNITIEKAFQAVKIIKKNSIYVQTFFIVGFPQETKSTLNDTISVIESIPADIIIYSIFTPYFGTELFDECKRQGMIPDDFDPSLYNHQSPKNYFCPNIEKDVFINRIRHLEKIIDRLNSRRKLKIYFSREGLIKLKEIGLRRSISRFFHFLRNAI